MSKKGPRRQHDARPKARAVPNNSLRQAKQMQVLPKDPTATVEEAAELLGLSRNGAYNAVREGSIPSIRIGRCIRVPRALLHKMLGL